MGLTPMPHSYTSILIHVIFSTKDRQSQLDAVLEERLHPYLAGIVRELGGKLFAVNGAEDHLHLLISTKGAMSTAEIVRKIKGSSSKWIHETFPDRVDFAWQRGYAAFSVSESQSPRVAAYIDRQKIHHQKISFRDEFLRLLRAHGISPEEKYLWT
jgi:putative transposase